MRLSPAREACSLYAVRIEDRPRFPLLSGFDSVKAHVSWVYCAYILLHMSPPGVPADVKSLGDKKRRIQNNLAHKEKRRILQKLTQIGGVERYKDELRQALAGT